MRDFEESGLILGGLLEDERWTAGWGQSGMCMWVDSRHRDQGPDSGTGKKSWFLIQLFFFFNYTSNLGK